jgi:L-ascorbate 6-phosphate lactonase
MSAVDLAKIDRDSWLRDVFPEWGTYLNDDIEETRVPPGKFCMWWLCCTGLWVKTPGEADLTVDFWAQRGMAAKKSPPYEEIKDTQLVRMTGSRVRCPFIRVSPQVIDPFAVKKMDALLSTHIHRDHICQYVAAATLKNTEAVFIGPKLCGDIWASWGVPEKRIIRMKPGDRHHVKDTEIIAMQSFDRTALLLTIS